MSSEPARSLAPTLRPVSPARFRDACARFASGVAVVTVADGEGHPHGITVSSFSSVSLHPPLVLVCIDHRSTVLPHLRVAGAFAVNILAEPQRDLSIRFSEAPEGRFEGVAWKAGETGAPLLYDTLAFLECRSFDFLEAGDHTVVLGEVVSTAVREGAPLVYFDREYRRME